jgi:hypothetical protein
MEARQGLALDAKAHTFLQDEDFSSAVNCWKEILADPNLMQEFQDEGEGGYGKKEIMWNIALGLYALEKDDACKKLLQKLPLEELDLCEDAQIIVSEVGVNAP